MKIAFFGTPLFAKEILEQLFTKHDVVAVITQPDRPFGRKQEYKSSEVKLFAQAHNIPVFQPEKLDQNLLLELGDLDAELFVVVAFGQFFPESFLNAKICLNVHASILPHLRGASPLQEMILEDKRDFGVSIMKMDLGVDDGEIMALGYLVSEQNLSLPTLSNQLAQIGGNLLLKTLEKIKEISPLKQIHCDSTYCKKIKKEEGRVDFSSGKTIVNKLLAFSTWPSVFLDNGLKLLSVDFILELSSQEPGSIVTMTQEYVDVACGDGILRIFEVQPPSKQRMKVVDYVRGKRWNLGEKFC